MSSIKKLAGQTVWYGLSSIAARSLNYALAFLHVTLFKSAEYGDVSIFYANAALLNILFTYGMETTFFRFVQDKQLSAKVYSTGFLSLAVTTFLLTALLILLRQPVADFMEVGQHPEWITWLAIIIASDTLAALPFALLRQQNRPKKYAAIKIINILLTILIQVFFFWLYPLWFGGSIDIGYVFLSNLIASAVTLLLLWKEIMSLDFSFDMELWKKMIRYSMPLIVVGLGGMINETIDRQLLLHFWEGTVEEAKSAIGIYSANYKLAILIVLFIQGFRMGAEPFFFQQAADKNAPSTYARIMKFFVIACCLCFLFIVLFLDVWKSLITLRHDDYGLGIMVVPILALSKVFLGIYYNLSIWYKLTDRNLTGAAITVGGAAITIAVNILLIPHIGYFASAAATFLCYSFMMVISYTLGQKYYPIPYPTGRMALYILISVLLFGVHYFISMYTTQWVGFILAFPFLGIFVYAIGKYEKHEFARLPVVGRFYKNRI